VRIQDIATVSLGLPRPGCACRFCLKRIFASLSKMTALTNDSKISPQSQKGRKSRTRIVILVLFVLFAIIFTLKPPFVVRPLVDPAGTGTSAQNAQSAAAKFVDPIWTSKVLPTIQEKAQDIAKILPEIRADPESAGQKYGRREATNPYNYMVKGTGQVAEVHNQSQAGTAIVEIPGLNEKVALQIGPVVRGTALRDATGVVSFNQFSNQLDYADVSKEMNLRALKTALAGLDPASLAGKTVTFFGTLTFDPHSKSLVLITPVKITP
jgi:predicted lipoprotein